MEFNLDVFLNTIEGFDYYTKTDFNHDTLINAHKYFLLEILSYRNLYNSKNLKTQYNKYFQKFKGKNNLKLKKVI